MDLNKEMVFLILQFLQEEDMKDTLHKLEQECGYYFNLKYFEERILAGDWDESEKYLSAFTKIHDNQYSMAIFFEIRKQKYFEALDRHDRAAAAEILRKDLKIFSTFNEELYKDITNLITLENLRENEKLAQFGDAISTRSSMMVELKKLIHINPCLAYKLQFPTLEISRLRHLVNHSMNWQHLLCQNPKPNPAIESLFTDHTCSSPPKGPQSSTSTMIPAAATEVAKHPSYPSFLGSFQPSSVGLSANALPAWMVNGSPSSSSRSPSVPASLLSGPSYEAWMVNGSPSSSSRSPSIPASLLSGPSYEAWMVNGSPSSSSRSSSVLDSLLPGPSNQAWMVNGSPSSSSHSSVLASFLPGPSNQASALRASRQNTLSLMDHQNIDRDQQMRNSVRPQSIEEVLQAPYTGTPIPVRMFFQEFPVTVVCKFHLGSDVTTIDFHPFIHNLLAVGCANGEISIWDAKLKEKVATKSFKIWNISKCSVAFQAAHLKEHSISVNRVAWSPDASFLGVAFEKHLVHLYTYQAPNSLQKHLEIDAHEGSVNDLTFSYPKNQLCIVTCGDDKLIKVWDLNGNKVYNFEDHVAPVYSVLPRSKENDQFLYSTSVDGKISVRLYENENSEVQYEFPGQCGATLIYGPDGRLFACGTSKHGEIFLVEWSETEGKVKRTYTGISNKSAGIVQFDIAKNRYLVIGVDNRIMIWDMDCISLLIDLNAEGGLSNLPRLRFNKKGNLLAVTTADGGLKVLANDEGRKFLGDFEEPTDIKDEMILALQRNLDKRNFEAARTRQMTEIIHHVQFRIVTMPDGMDSSNKVIRLLYTNNGVGLLALSSKGIHKMWKLRKDNELNPSGKATASVIPQLWTQSDGVHLTNDVPNNGDSAIPCMDISKNDYYVMAACGGKVSLFNMVTFKVMFYFMPPPPATTFLAFSHPDNNIIAAGMEDSDIHIFNVRLTGVQCKLKGHQKYITGITFSIRMNTMVSAGADAQLFSWSISTWKKRKSVSIQLPNSGNAPGGETTVQFHNDQLRFLVCHETQLAVYDASKMVPIRKWMPQTGLSGSISSATYSCDGKQVYATFIDGNIGVFDAYTLILRCRITPSEYIHQIPSNSPNAYPLVVAAHPQKPEQFAIGLSNGSVLVFEPIETEDWWGKKSPIVKIGGM